MAEFADAGTDEFDYFDEFDDFEDYDDDDDSDWVLPVFRVFAALVGEQEDNPVHHPRHPGSRISRQAG
ncbi:MAG: hypothetical protein OSB76_08185 [Alphaproteobacteria bacterium]|jgi:hypothetical protein|nr:hypothetical protein [Alphaproteobacteria bacterium]